VLDDLAGRVVGLGDTVGELGPADRPAVGVEPFEQAVTDRLVLPAGLVIQGSEERVRVFEGGVTAGEVALPVLAGAVAPGLGSPMTCSLDALQLCARRRTSPS
jgi:hypothetical protein